MHILLIADDVWSAFTINSNLAIVYPHSQDLSCTLILACLLTERIELVLKVLNALRLFFDFHLVFTNENILELLCLVLVTHLSLSPSSLASWLENVDTSSLRRYHDKAHTMIVVRSQLG